MATKGFSNNKFRNKGGRKPKKFKSSFLTRLIIQEGITLQQDINLGELPPKNKVKDPSKEKNEQRLYRIFRSKAYMRYLRRLPTFAKFVFGCDTKRIVLAITNHIKWYEELVRHKGCLYAVKTLKRVRDACTRFMADQSFEQFNDLKCHSDGLPLKVGHMRDMMISKDINQRRCVVLILDLIKLVEVEGDTPSLVSITQPNLGIPKDIGYYIGDTITNYGINSGISKDEINKVTKAFRSTLERMFPARLRKRRVQKLKELNDIHMSVRKGPNGPALGNIKTDYLGISQSGLLDSIKTYCKEVDHIHLLTIVKGFEKEYTSDELQEVKWLDSRLSIKIEPWGKTRFFAICDWFTQSALKGMHHYMFRWLAKQAEDGTMDQNLVADIVCQWTNPITEEESKGIYSLDLSKATDRLPASLQREIISWIFSKEIGDEWYTIVTNRQFKVPDTDDKVRFAVGQPLGAYSSWAMLAVTHHVICRTAMKLSGIRHLSKRPSYVVIGDDVAIRGDQFADSYSLIMNKILRVDVSPIKGFTPQTSLGLNPLLRGHRSVSAEIAKRIFVDGLELSTVSPDTVKTGLEYPNDFPNLLRQITNRTAWLRADNTVTPAVLAAQTYKPDTAWALALFPLRPALSQERVEAVQEMKPALLENVAWFRTSKLTTVSIDELDQMFRFSIRSSLLKSLDSFKERAEMYLSSGFTDFKLNDRMYHSATQTYVIRCLINKALVHMLSLVENTDALNYSGSGRSLDDIASALNTLADFEIALRGKPSSKRENLHRMRSRVITSLQPFLLQAIRKADENYGILLVDKGEQISFVSQEYLDVDILNLETRAILEDPESQAIHDTWYAKVLDQGINRTTELST